MRDPCTLAFKASKSFEHREFIRRMILAIIEHTTNPEFQRTSDQSKDSLHFDARARDKRGRLNTTSPLHRNTVTSTPIDDA